MNWMQTQSWMAGWDNFQVSFVAQWFPASADFWQHLYVDVYRNVWADGDAGTVKRGAWSNCTPPT